MNIVTKPIKSADENICGAEFSVVSNGSGMDYGTASQKLTFNAFTGGDSGSSASGQFVFNSEIASATIQLDYELAAHVSVREFKQATVKKPEPGANEPVAEIVYQDNAYVSLEVIRNGVVQFNKAYNLKEEDAEGNWVSTKETGAYFGGGFSISMPTAMGAPYKTTLQRLDVESAVPAVFRIAASARSITASVKLSFALEDKASGFTTREREAIDAALRHYEGYTDFMYRDSEGFVTAGVGFMMLDEDSALAYPFLDDSDNPASDEQKRAEWRLIHSLPQNYIADWYEDHASLYLTDEFINSKLSSTIDENFSALSRIFPDIEEFPSAARVALQDMVYNTGEGGLRAFVLLRAAIERRDWQTAAGESHRVGPGPERNNAIRDLFLSAAGNGDF
ncbi:MAG: hypothetical protein ACN6P0_12610 [Pseudomonas capeferrum]|uniref:hypothetical protein n=1 Tax=Pseudomonas capeferrum TaxID=1495066 RepID=UPI003D10476F